MKSIYKKNKVDKREVELNKKMKVKNKRSKKR